MFKFHDHRRHFVQSSIELLDAISSTNRLAILLLIADREVTVGTLSYEIGISQSGLSQHLAKLRAAGLVSSRRQAQMIYYRCESHAVKRIMAALHEIFPLQVEPNAEAAQGITAELPSIAN